MRFQIKKDLDTNSIPSTYAILGLPERIRSPFQRELFKQSGLPFHNLHLSSQQTSSPIDHIPFQVGSSTVLPEEFILGYKLCERKLNNIGRCNIRARREREAAHLVNRLHPSDLCQTVTTLEHKGWEKAPQKQKNSQSTYTQ